MYQSEAMPFPVYYAMGSAVPEGAYWQMMGGVSMMDGSVSQSSHSTSPEEKVRAANKSHSEAERRRRERINNHLSHLRTLIPNSAKADKASLLKAVVDQVRDLKRQAAEAVSGGDVRSATGLPMLPGEVDGVTLEAEHGRTTIRATVCCEDRPELMAELEAALRTLRMGAVRAEIIVVGGRTKAVLQIKGTEADCAAIRRVMKAVVDRGGRSGVATVVGGSKRQRFGGSNRV